MEEEIELSKASQNAIQVLDGTKTNVQNKLYLAVDKVCEGMEASLKQQVPNDSNDISHQVERTGEDITASVGVLSGEFQQNDYDNIINAINDTVNAFKDEIGNMLKDYIISMK
ncbi:hypothetical protein IAI10_14220 [Clostridium sp. 19966]|uniref:hypothetical protein n=1 Tax=Clostridium sp. 19966 TaxID=2768166 RepID=UPI0028DF6146|nr:hypothetical protein [Clostridium sp. 19966]MDT8717820.1 hypothetical protein [Clostridium sp. 19966]